MRKFGDKRILGMYLVCFILLGIGFTYALVSDSLALNTTTAMIGIDEAAYGSTTFDSENLDFKPILDSTVGTTESEDNVIKIDFTVGGAETNDADKPIIYDIALNDLELNCALLSPYIKWRLLKNDTQIAEGSLDYKQGYVIEDNRLVLTTVQQDLPGYDVSGGSYDNYTFYMWFSDSCQSDLATCKANSQLVDQSALLGQNLSGKVEVELYTGSKKELIRNPSTSVEEGVVCFSQYQVEFETNGGTLSNDQSSMTVISNQTYGELPTPTRENASVSYDANGGILDSGVTNPGTINWTFDGWYKESTFITAVTSETTVTDTQNHILYAKWSSSNTITLPSASRDGYIFDGWYTLASGGVRVGGSGSTYNGDGEVTLYAHWIEDTEAVKVYTVTYYNGENTLDTSSHVYDINSSLTLWSNLGGSITNSDAGWSFAGWSTDDTGTVITYNDGQGIINLTSENGGNVDLYAIYKRDITFVHGASGGMISSLEQFWNPFGTTGAYVSGVEVPQLTAITNWTALGFRDDMSAGNKEHDVGSIISPGVSSDVTTFYGAYTRTLTFYSGINKAKSDGTRTQYLNANTNNTVSSVTSYTPTDISVDDYITDDSYMLEEHNDTGWVSLGYRIDTTNGTNQFDSATSIVVDYSTGNDLYAVYSRSYTARFYSGVNKATTETGVSDTAYYNSFNSSLPTTVTITLLGNNKSTNITNWNELGWRDDTEASSSGREYAYDQNGVSVPFGTDFYGNYSRTVNVTYDGNGATSGSVSSSSNYQVYLNSASTLTSRNMVGMAASNGFSKTGYKFLGWAIGSVDSSETVTPGNSFYLPSLEYDASPFTATLYAIWQDNTAPTATISSTNTLKATSQSVTLTCKDNDGVTSYYWGMTNPSSSSVVYTSISSTTEYVLNDEISTSEFGTHYLSCKDAVGNVKTSSTVFYSYRVDNYTENIDGTTGVYTTANYGLETSYNYIAQAGTTITFSSIYTMPTTGFNFGAASVGTASTTSPELTYNASSSVQLSGNTVYSVWFNRKTYTITYNANGGTGAPTSQTKKYGVELELSTVEPTRTNYGFVGWATSSTATTATRQPGEIYSTNASLSLYAVWGAVECNYAGIESDYFVTLTAGLDRLTTDGVHSCTLLNNLTEDVTISEAFDNLTIDLNQKTLTGFINSSNSATVLTLKNGTVEATASSGNAPIINKGNMIIPSGTYKTSVKQTTIINHGTLEISGGTFINDSSLANNSVVANSASGATLNVTGGTFNLTRGEGGAYAILVYDGSVNLMGGSITSDGEGIYSTSGSTIIDGMTIETTSSDEGIVNSGGSVKIYGITLTGSASIDNQNGDGEVYLYDASSYSIPGTIKGKVYRLWNSSSDENIVGVGIINPSTAIVRCPSWTNDGDQSDIQHYDAERMSAAAGEDIYYCRFDKRNHDSTTGEYITHFYTNTSYDTSYYEGGFSWYWGFPK